MGFIKTVVAERPHKCAVPPAWGLGVGTVWACDACGLIWGIHKCLSMDLFTLDWRGMKDGKFRSVFSSARYPGARQKATLVECED
jgi:hypothetical protein